MTGVSGVAAGTLHHIHSAPSRASMVTFVAIYTAIMVAMCFVVMPLGGMDEGAHFLRTMSIAAGEFAPVTPVVPLAMDSRGGYVDTGADDLVKSLADVPGVRLHEDLSTVRRWLGYHASNRLDYAPHSNTAIYVPVVYAPQAIAVTIARRVTDRPIAWFYAARLAGAVTFCALLALAMRISPGTAPVLGVVAVLPIFPFQIGTLTSDTLILGSAVVFAACVGRMLRTGSLNRSTIAVLTAATIMLVVTKLVYAGLAIVPLAIALFYGHRRSIRWASILLGVSLIVAAAWMAEVRHDVVPVRTDPYASPIVQLAWMKTHPARAAAVVLGSAIRDFPGLLPRMAGVLLSHDDLWVPQKFTLPLLAAAIGLVGLAMGRRDNRAASLVLLMVSAAGYLLVTLLLYMQWSAIGAKTVEGVQGRYLLPFLLAFSSLPLAPLAERFVRTALPYVGVCAAIPLWVSYRAYWA